MDGILVGCDRNQEWLLPWWWNHFTRHNSYPVAFADFGMSEKALNWCRERGEIMTLPLGPVDAAQTEGIRSAWFKKPFACLCSSFSRTCWIDLDCEIKTALSSLFVPLSNGVEIALVREPEYVQAKAREMSLILPDETSYNSGVVAFCQEAPILRKWAELSQDSGGKFHGDQDALSRAIYLYRPNLTELSAIYNWKMNLGPNPEALILHYVSRLKSSILLSIECKN